MVLTAVCATTWPVNLQTRPDAHRPLVRSIRDIAREPRPVLRPRRRQGALVLNGVQHGLCGRTFFLLADEDPAEFGAHEAIWLAA